MNKDIVLEKKERIDDLGIGNLKLIQNSEYFCFGTDSALLANFVNSNSSKNIILDLCSGAGSIPVIMSGKKKYSKIVGVELQEEMANLFEKNIKYNSLENKVFLVRGDIKDIKLIRENIKNITGKQEVDIIVCNPPYKNVGTGVPNENKVKYIARHEIMCNLEDIFKTSAKIIKEKGKLYLVHKPERLVDLFSIAREYNFEPKTLRLVVPKMGMSPSIVLIEYAKNGGNELKVLPPLIEYEENGNYTKEFLEIYGINNSI